MGSSEELFRKVKGNCKIFVESGTYGGDGIQKALNAGYEEIYSCDINKERIDKAKEIFAGKNVTLFCDPSDMVFKEIFKNINEQCVIFLDGHAMPYDENNALRGYGEDTIKKGYPHCPLLQEVDEIKNSKINNHTIIIDDAQCFGTWIFDGITFDEVARKVYEINRNYKYYFENNVLIFTV